MMHRREARSGPRRDEAGFTLIEALVAIVILIFGLMAVSNLMLVATSSTSVANQSTAATVAASEVLETIKGTAWPLLLDGGDLANDVGATGPCDGPVAGTYNCDAEPPGVGRIHVRWVISTPVGAARTRIVQVQAEGTGALAGARSRALFTMFRTCTEAPASTGGPCPDPPIGGGL